MNEKHLYVLGLMVIITGIMGIFTGLMANTPGAVIIGAGLVASAIWIIFVVYKEKNKDIS